MNAGHTPCSPGTSDPQSAISPTEAPYEVERVLALVDEVIGLKAELAAQQYRHDLAVWALTERAAQLEARAVQAETHMNAMKVSRSWRLGQALLRPAEATRHLLRSIGERQVGD